MPSATRDHSAQHRQSITPRPRTPIDQRKTNKCKVDTLQKHNVKHTSTASLQIDRRPTESLHEPLLSTEIVMWHSTPPPRNASVPSSQPLPKTAKKVRVSRRAEREKRLRPERLLNFAQEEGKSTVLLQSDIVRKMDAEDREGKARMSKKHWAVQ